MRSLAQTPVQSSVSSEGRPGCTGLYLAGLVLKNSKDGDCITCLCNMHQCFTALVMEKLFLKSRQILFQFMPAGTYPLVYVLCAILYFLCLTGYIPLVEERVKVCKLNLAASNVNFILAGI